MDKDEIPRWEYNLEGWQKKTRGYIERTPGVITTIEDGSAKDDFTYNWGLIYQVCLGNESINRYLDSETISKCKILYNAHDEIHKKYSPGEELEGLPPITQDKLAGEKLDSMFDDTQFLSMYRSKLELEKQILAILENSAKPSAD